MRQALVIAFAVVIFDLSWLADLGAQSALLGQALYSTGTLIVQRPDGIEDRLRGRGAMNLFELDILRTEANSQALLDFDGGTQIGLNESTVVLLVTRWEKTNGITKIIRVTQGEVWAKSGSAGSKSIEIETSTGTAVVQNAEMTFKVLANGQSVLSVFQGVVPYATAYGWCDVKASTSTTGAQGRGCSPPTAIKTQQAAAWARELVR